MNLFSFSRHLPAIMLLSIAFTSSAQFRSVSLADTLIKGSESGLTYTLPRTGLTIHLVVRKLEKTPGPLAAYAREYLGIDNVPSGAVKVYSLERTEITSYVLPDPGQVYGMMRKKGLNPFACSPAVNLSQEGYLLSLGRCRPMPAAALTSPALPGPDPRKIYSRDSYSYLLGATLPKSSNSDSTPVQRLLFKVKSGEDPVQKKAREAAESLARIRENRLNLASGYQEVAYAEGTFRSMVDELNATEEYILNQFTGTTTETFSVITLDLMPGANDTLPILLGHFSPAEGFTASPYSNGERIILTINQPGYSTPLETQKQGSGKKPPLRTVAYRVPAKVKITIKAGDREMYAGNHMLPQWGSVAWLPKKVKNACFNAETGGLLRIR